MFMTLDGFTETKEGELIGPEWSNDLRTQWAQVNVREGQMLLYGRTSFELISTFWPRMADEAPTADFREFAAGWIRRS
ncbi:MAG: hypothetical protein ACRDVC_07250 [Acidimicrobiales bacterium]